MKQLLILGGGCSRCTKLYEATEQAAQKYSLVPNSEVLREPEIVIEA